MLGRDSASPRMRFHPPAVATLSQLLSLELLAFVQAKMTSWQRIGKGSKLCKPKVSYRLHVLSPSTCSFQLEFWLYLFRECSKISSKAQTQARGGGSLYVTTPPPPGF